MPQSRRVTQRSSEDTGQQPVLGDSSTAPELQCPLGTGALEGAGPCPKQNQGAEVTSEELSGLSP